MVLSVHALATEAKEVSAAFVGATAAKYADAADDSEMIVVEVVGAMVVVVALELLEPLDPHAASSNPVTTIASKAP